MVLRPCSRLAHGKGKPLRVTAVLDSKQVNELSRKQNPEGSLGLDHHLVRQRWMVVRVAVPERVRVNRHLLCPYLLLLSSLLRIAHRLKIRVGDTEVLEKVCDELGCLNLFQGAASRATLENCIASIKCAYPLYSDTPVGSAGIIHAITLRLRREWQIKNRLVLSVRYKILHGHRFCGHYTETDVPVAAEVCKYFVAYLQFLGILDPLIAATGKQKAVLLAVFP